MINNNILRRVRYIFDYNDEQMIALFAMADYQVTREQVSNWLKKDDDPDYKAFNDKILAIFLNGLINDKCGKREGAQVEPEKHLGRWK